MGIQAKAGGVGAVARVLMVLAFASLVAGCAKDGSVQEHAPAAPNLLPYARIGSGEEVRGDSNADADVVAFLSANDIAGVTKTIAAAEKATAPAEKAKLLESAAGSLLRQDLIAPKAAQNDDLVRAYHRFTDELMRTYRFEHMRETTAPLLVRYEALVVAGCDAELKQCLNLQFFLKVGNVRDVLSANLGGKAAETCQGAAEGSYHRRLLLAYALFPRGTDEPRLDALYLRCAMPRLKALEAQANDPRKAAELSRLAMDLERILVRPEKFAGNPELEGMVAKFRKELEPETYVDSIQPTNPTQKILSDMRKLVLQGNAGAINEAGFAERIRKLNYEQADPYNYDRVQEMFAEKKTPIAANLRIQPLATRDAIFTIVDAVATKRWTPAMGVAFFEKLRKDDAKKSAKALEETLKAYSQAMFLKEIVETNGDMAAFYREKNLATKQLIQDAIDASQGLQKNWVEFYARIELLRQFAGSALSLPANRLVHLGLDVKSLVLASNYMIAFPHMLMMAYHLAEKGFDISIQTIFGVFKINYVDVIEWIFEGGMPPWFTYSPGKPTETKEYMFNNTQILQSLYFAFRTEAFKVFGLDEEKFLKRIIDTLTYNHRQLYRDSIFLQTESLSMYHEEYQNMRQACVEEKKRSDAKRENKSYVPQYRAELNFEDVRDGLLSTTKWFKALTGDRINQTMLSSTLIRVGELGLSMNFPYAVDRLDMKRLGTGRVVRLVDSILGIYRQFLKDKGMTAAEIDKRIANISGGYKALRHEQRRYNTMMSDFVDKVTKGCLVRLELRENELFNQVWDEEIQHLRDVYRDKVRILNGETSYEDVIGKYRFAGYESIGYVGKDDFSGNQYRYTMIDAHMRLQRHLAKVAPYISVDMPTPETLKDRSAFRDTMRVANISFFDRDGQLVSEDEFVRTALSFGGDPEVRSWKYFFNWEPSFSVKHLMRTNEYHTHVMTALYKQGELEVYPAGKPECLSPEAPASGCSVEKRRFVTADELVQQQADLAWLISVKPEEEKAYELRGIPAKMKFEMMWGSLGGTGYKIWDMFTAGTLMDPRYGTATGFFDYPFHYLTSRYLGIPAKLVWTTLDEESPYLPQRYPLWSHLNWYYEAHVALEFMPFAIDPETGKMLDDVYRGSFQTEEGFVRDYISAVDRRQQEDERIGYKRRLRRNLHEEPYYGPYLTPRYVSDYNQSIKEFHRDTKGFFLDQRKPDAQ